MRSLPPLVSARGWVGVPGYPLGRWMHPPTHPPANSPTTTSHSTDAKARRRRSRTHRAFRPPQALRQRERQPRPLVAQELPGVLNLRGNIRPDRKETVTGRICDGAVQAEARARDPASRFPARDNASAVFSRSTNAADTPTKQSAHSTQHKAAPPPRMITHLLRGPPPLRLLLQTHRLRPAPRPRDVAPEPLGNAPRVRGGDPQDGGAGLRQRSGRELSGVGLRGGRGLEMGVQVCAGWSGRCLLFSCMF